MTDQVILLGRGGHARVVLDAARQAGSSVVGFTAPEADSEELLGAPYLGTDQVLEEYHRGRICLLNGIGLLPGGERVRERLFSRLEGEGYQFTELVHPRATLSSSAEIEAGAQVMMGACVQTRARLGRNCIVNTGATVDHDCQISAHAHIAPGATLTGDVRVGRGAFVGAGATVVQGAEIGEYGVVGAGAVVLDSVAPYATVAGSPAHELDR